MKMWLKSVFNKFKTSYKYKLSWYFSVAILVPLLVIFLTVIFFMTNSSLETIDDKMNIQKSVVVKRLEDALTNLNNKMFYPLDMSSFNEILNINRPLNLCEQVEASEKLSVMSSFFPADSAEKITIYTTNPHLYIPAYLKNVTEEKMQVLMENSEETAKIEFKGNSYKLSVYKAYPWKYTDHKSLLHISVPIDKIFSDYKSGLNNDFFVYYSTDGSEFVDIMISDKEKKPDIAEYIKNEKLKNFSVQSFKMPTIDGKFYIFKNIETENSEMITTILLLVFAFILLMFLVILLVNFITKALTNKLTSIILEIELGNIKAPQTGKNNENEFYIIHNKLYELTSNLKKENEKILQIENELLNQKISPHFLYNNLSAIKWTYNDERLENVIEALTTYYRNIFQKNGVFILLKEELDNLEIYISLLRFAYEQDFSYEVTVDKSISSITIMSNMIQPLVENAFLHSLNNTDEKTSFIKINVVKKAEAFCIEVINNHCRETEERLNSIVRSDGKSALSIIQKRINLYYGENFGLCFEKDGDVLTARLSLPIID